jgi:hypothetical protein
MPIFSSDIEPALMRALEALDRGESITFQQLRERVFGGTLRGLIEQAGHYPGIGLTPYADWVEINNAVRDTWAGSINDEAEHWYVSNNGYCLLIALLRQVDKLNSLGPQRPIPAPADNVVRISHWLQYDQHNRPAGRVERGDDDQWTAYAIDTAGNSAQLGVFPNHQEASAAIFAHHQGTQ